MYPRVCSHAHRLSLFMLPRLPLSCCGRLTSRKKKSFSPSNLLSTSKSVHMPNVRKQKHITGDFAGVKGKKDRGWEKPQLQSGLMVKRSGTGLSKICNDDLFADHGQLLVCFPPFPDCLHPYAMMSSRCWYASSEIHKLRSMQTSTLTPTCKCSAYQWQLFIKHSFITNYFFQNLVLYLPLSCCRVDSGVGRHEVVRHSEQLW